MCQHLLFLFFYSNIAEHTFECIEIMGTPTACPRERNQILAESTVLWHSLAAGRKMQVSTSAHYTTKPMVRLASIMEEHTAEQGVQKYYPRTDHPSKKKVLMWPLYLTDSGNAIHAFGDEHKIPFIKSKKQKEIGYDIFLIALYESHAQYHTGQNLENNNNFALMLHKHSDSPMMLTLFSYSNTQVSTNSMFEARNVIQKVIAFLNFDVTEAKLFQRGGMLI